MCRRRLLADCPACPILDNFRNPAKKSRPRCCHDRVKSRCRDCVGVSICDHSRAEQAQLEMDVQGLRRGVHLQPRKAEVGRARTAAARNSAATDGCGTSAGRQRAHCRGDRGAEHLPSAWSDRSASRAAPPSARTVSCGGPTAGTAGSAYCPHGRIPRQCKECRPPPPRESRGRPPQTPPRLAKRARGGGRATA